MTAKESASKLSTPIQYVKGVGPPLEPCFHTLGIRTVKDLLFFFPRDYDEAAPRVAIRDLTVGEWAWIQGTVGDIQSRTTAKGKKLLEAVIVDGEARLYATWFNAQGIEKILRVGESVRLGGTAWQDGPYWRMTHPRWKRGNLEEEQETDTLVPVYRLTKGLRQETLRKIMRGALDAYCFEIQEAFPESWRQERTLLEIAQALEWIHFPPDRENLEQARRRLVYQECLVPRLAAEAARVQEIAESPAIVLPVDARLDARIRRLLPFDLTEGQNVALKEITTDLASEAPMRRLLQGDVGSGKTAVALYAMLVAVAHGHQAALMVPTEILARQHSQRIQAYLRRSHVRMGVLSKGTPGAERKRLLAAARDGEVDLLIGTQALLRADLGMRNLALVVVDEQHRFGVRQRTRLRAAGRSPHLLVMSATPIPRSVALGQFGDLDITTIQGVPEGRQPVKTYLVRAEQGEKWWEFVRRKLREGRQAYIVAPFAQEKRTEYVADVESLFEKLTNDELSSFRVAHVHGKMATQEKLGVMEDFRQGNYQALVATSLVEVGMDVPNATIMTIYHPQQFGLAQLHQLRGRVARGSHAGYCACLLTEASVAARERLENFARVTDGFRLAELDLKARGQGDVWGTRQHGAPKSLLIDFSRDANILEQAAADARQLVQDGAWEKPAFDRLRGLVARYSSRAAWSWLSG